MRKNYTAASLAALLLPVLVALVPGVSEAVHDAGGQDALVAAAAGISAFIGHWGHQHKADDEDE